MRYLSELEAKDNKVIHLVLNQPIELNENTITIHLANPIQIDQLASIKQDLLDYVRFHLKNDLIDLVGVVNLIDHKRKLYTAEEKLNYLLDKNPSFRELKDRLGLELDY